MENEIFENIYRKSVLEAPLDTESKPLLLSENEDFVPYTIISNGNDDYQNQLFEKIYELSRRILFFS
jgi:hypothetical protein